MKLSRSVSLTERLIINFLMLGISAIVVFGIYSYRTSRKVLTQKTYEHLCTVRDIKQNQLQQYFADRIRDINSLRNSNEVKQLLTNSDKQLNHLYESFLMNYLSSVSYTHLRAHETHH